MNTKMIRVKLIAGFLVMLALIIGVSSIAIYNLDYSIAMERQINSLHQVRGILLEMRRQEKNYLLRREETYLEQALFWFEKLKGLSIQQLQLEVNNPHLHNYWLDIIQQEDIYLKHFQDYVKQLKTISPDNKNKDQEIDTIDKNMVQAIRNVHKGIEQILAWENELITKNQINIRHIFLGTFFMALLLSLIVIATVMQSVQKSLSLGLQFITSLADDRIDNSLNSDNNELTPLLNALIELKQRFIATKEKNIRQLIEMEKIHRQLEENLESESQLRKWLNSELAAAEQREHELAQAHKHAENATQAKNIFLANMSHEFRTPLNAIIGYSEMLLEEAEDMQESALTIDLQKIHTAAKHLLSLINDILDLSKIEVGKMELFLETFSVMEMINEVVSTITPLVKKKNNTLQVQSADNLGTMHADLIKTRQCIFNLLSNAAKFTENGIITLRIDRKIEPDREWLIFQVEDQGIGINASDMQRLFEPFTQADSSTTRKFGGTGLGLTITMRICEMMGGNITATSELGQGSIFTIRLPALCQKLPVAEPPLVHIEEQINNNSAQQGAVVLVIDDDPAVRDLVQRFLVKEGFHVETATNGEDGLRLAKIFHPYAITLDVIMPGMDGWSVLKALKESSDTANIPVIMLSFTDNQELSFALNAVEYLSKPVNREQLLRALRKYRKGTVLIVSNNPIIRETTQHMMIKEGCQVIEAENYQEGLEKITHLKPDLILVDCNSVDSGGFITTVKQQNIPIFDISAPRQKNNFGAQNNSFQIEMLAKTNLDFATARAMHLAWRARLQFYLEEKIILNEQEIISYQDCQLGRWIYTHGIPLYGHLPEMKRLEDVHIALHTSIRRVIELKKYGTKEHLEDEYAKFMLFSSEIIALLRRIEQNMTSMQK